MEPEVVAPESDRVRWIDSGSGPGFTLSERAVDEAARRIMGARHRD